MNRDLARAIDSHIENPMWSDMYDEKYPHPDRGVYVKYRIFREPEEATEHPVDVSAWWWNGPVGQQGTSTRELIEVESWVFVLKPDSDHHARVALASYAESVRPTDPKLAADLDTILADFRDQGGDS